MYQHVYESGFVVYVCLPLVCYFDIATNVGDDLISGLVQNGTRTKIFDNFLGMHVNVLLFQLPIHVIIIFFTFFKTNE